MPRIIYYRDKCIGCGVCQQLQPQLWRMSKKDGKATLIHSVQKKQIHQLSIGDFEVPLAKEVIAACPARIIKLNS